MNFIYWDSWGINPGKGSEGVAPREKKGIHGKGLDFIRVKGYVNVWNCRVVKGGKESNSEVIKFNNMDRKPGFFLPRPGVAHGVGPAKKKIS